MEGCVDRACYSFCHLGVAHTTLVTSVFQPVFADQSRPRGVGTVLWEHDLFVAVYIGCESSSRTGSWLLLVTYTYLRRLLLTLKPFQPASGVDSRALTCFLHISSAHADGPT
jgi:hypothetical protein